MRAEHLKFCCSFTLFKKSTFSSNLPINYLVVCRFWFKSRCVRCHLHLPHSSSRDSFSLVLDFIAIAILSAVLSTLAAIIVSPFFLCSMTWLLSFISSFLSTFRLPSSLYLRTLFASSSSSSSSGGMRRTLLEWKGRASSSRKERRRNQDGRRRREFLLRKWRTKEVVWILRVCQQMALSLQYIHFLKLLFISQGLDPILDPYIHKCIKFGWQFDFNLDQYPSFLFQATSSSRSSPHSL